MVLSLVPHESCSSDRRANCGCSRLASQERLRRIAEPNVVVLLPQDIQEVVEEFKIASQEQFPQRIGELSVDDSLPRYDDAESIGERRPSCGRWSLVLLETWIQWERGWRPRVLLARLIGWARGRRSVSSPAPQALILRSRRIRSLARCRH